MDWVLYDNGLRHKKVNPIEDVPFRGCSRMEKGQEGSFSPKNLSHISCNKKTWFICPLPKEDPKNMNHVTHHLSSPEISFFFSGNLQILLYQEIPI